MKNVRLDTAVKKDLDQDRKALGIVDDLNRSSTKGHRFNTVLADPPWRYANTSSRAAAENHYPTMTVEAICSEPVRDLAEDNSHLHL